MVISTIDASINTNVTTNKQWLSSVPKIYIENKSIDSEDLFDYPLVIADSDGNSHLICTNRYWKILTLKMSVQNIHYVQTIHN